MNKLLTVSIAAYNVEKYLAQTLLPMLSNEQITDRLFSAMEIIIVGHVQINCFIAGKITLIGIQIKQMKSVRKKENIQSI